MTNGINYNWIRFGIDKEMLRNIINPAFHQMTGQTLTMYMLDEGYPPVIDADTRRDETKIFYDVRKVEAQFMEFVASYRSAFVFKSQCLGWIKNVTYEEKQALIPDNFRGANGRTFEEALITSPLGELHQYEGNDVYPMFFYEIRNEDGTYTSTMNQNNDVDFWAFYDFFGKERVILDYKIMEAWEK